MNTFMIGCVLLASYIAFYLITPAAVEHFLFQPKRELEDLELRSLQIAYDVPLMLMYVLAFTAVSTAFVELAILEFTRPRRR